MQGIVAGTWNISSVNNNPFEYWISHPDPRYDSMMQSVQNMIQNPDEDVNINEIFSDKMCAELVQELVGGKIIGADNLETLWNACYRGRTAISFLKDKEIGLKRLISMPDRITNTIVLADGQKCYRPTVINCFDESLATLDLWWAKWKTFMFHKEIQVCSSTQVESPPQLVMNLITPILRSKYPAISLEEQTNSIPLQILCLAIMDAILVWMLNKVAPTSWESLRRSIAMELIHNKELKICGILDSYADVEIFFIQEAAASFVRKLTSHPTLTNRYAALAPFNLDAKRNQNSLILVRHDRFPHANCATCDVTAQMLDFVQGRWVAPGDLMAASLVDRDGRRWLLVSFHGDSNGLSTLPWLEALCEAVVARFADHAVLVGLDANSHTGVDSAPGSGLQQGVAHFADFLRERRMRSMWPEDRLSALSTTCNARTSLQTQLNKATLYRDRAAARHRHLKDWIVCFQSQVTDITAISRDNTGSRHFIEDMVFPTLDFPSDHAIVSAHFSLAPPTPPILLQQSLLTCRTANTTASSSRSPVMASASEVQAKDNLNQDELVWAWKVFDSAKSTADASKQPADTAEQPPPSHWRGSSVGGSIGGDTGPTLYDYWGISRAPLAQARQPILDAPSFRSSGRLSELGRTARPALVQLNQLVERQARRAAAGKSYPHGLDRANRFYSRSEDRSVWIAFSSRPFTMALHKTWFQICVFVIAVFAITALLINASDAYLIPLRGRYFRFRPIEMRGIPIAAARGPGAAALGLLFEGCEVKEAYRVVWDGIGVVVDSNISLEVDGFWFVTPDGLPEEDTVLWALEKSIDGASWISVRYPMWILGTQIRDVPFQRQQRMEIDLRIPWPWMTMFAVAMAALIALVCSTLLGTLGRGRWGTLMAAISYFLHFTWESTMAVYYCSKSSAFEWSMTNFVSCVLDFSCCIAMIREPWAMDVLLLALLASTVATGVGFRRSAVQADDDMANLFTTLYQSITASLLIVVVVVRLLVRQWVFGRLLAGDRSEYHQAWEKLLADGSSCSYLGAIQTIVKRLPSKTLPRQGLCIQKTIGGYALAARFGLIPSSLDVVYCQAACVDILLREKVKLWALESNGYLPVKASSDMAKDENTGYQYLPAVTTLADPSLAVQWASLKPFDRALEKLLRSYACDASRLVDCCRQMVCFKNLEDLFKCLEAISQDGEVQVVRVKNRFDLASDSRLYGGFRAVVLNLSILTMNAQNLGVDSHVCELILTTCSFAELKTEEKHERYRVLRNCRRDSPFHPRHILYALAVTARCTRASCQALASLFHWADAATNISPLPSVHLEQKACKRKMDVEADTGLPVRKQMGISQEESLASSACSAGQVWDDEMEEDQRAAMEILHRLCAGRPRCFGLQREDLVVLALRHYTGAGCSVWQSDQPLVSSMLRPWFPWVALIVAVVVVSSWIPLLFVSASGGAGLEGFGFRYVALGNDSASIVAGGPLVKRFGVLRGGCPLSTVKNTFVSGKFGQGNWTWVRPDSDSFATPIAAGDPTLAWFGELVTFDGWYCLWDHHVRNADPPSFRFEVCLGLYPSVADAAPSSLQVNSTGKMQSASACSYWQSAWSSSAEWTWGGELVLNESPLPLPWQDEVYFDMRPPWVLSAHRIGIRVLELVALVALAASSALGQLRWGVRVLVAALVASAALRSTVCAFAIVSPARFLWPDAFLAGTLAAFDLALGGCLLANQRALEGVLLGGGLASMGSFVVYYAALLSRPGGLGGHMGVAIVLNDGLLESMVAAAVGSYAIFVRRAAIWRAELSTREDRRRFEAAWAQLVAADVQGNFEAANQMVLAMSLAAETAALEAACDAPVQLKRANCTSTSWSEKSESRHASHQGQGTLPRWLACCIRGWGGAGGDGNTGRVHAAGEDWVCVEDLDQLLAQAALLSPILRRRAQDWALASGGCFPVQARAMEDCPEGLGVAEEGAREYVAWEELRSNPGLWRGRVRWAGAKSAGRAAAKVCRGRVSGVWGLTDCCRCSVAYESAGGLRAGLEAVRGDAAVRVVRARSSLGGGLRARRNQGYRQVLVSFRLACEGTCP